MEDKLFTVYRHTSPSGKVYIGITCQDVKNKYNRKSGFSKGHYHMRNVLQFTKEGSLINTYISIRDVCRHTDFTYNCLCQALNGRRGGLYKGYIWKYEEKQ